MCIRDSRRSDDMMMWPPGRLLGRPAAFSVLRDVENPFLPSACPYGMEHRDIIGRDIIQ